MTTSRTKLATHLTLAITAAVIARKTPAGSKKRAFFDELSAAITANGVARWLTAGEDK